MRLRFVLTVIIATSLSSCSAFTGYPNDPFDTDTDLSILKQQSANDIALYYAADPALRKPIRDRIVYSRLAAYDLEFHKFQSEIFKESTSGDVAGDLVVLTLNGVGATTGGAGLKAAMNTASAGVVGASAAINKDLFFNQTIPLVLSQMSTSRSNQLSVIQKGLIQEDAAYTLASAMIDLEKYREAGSVPSAVNLLSANIHAADTEAKKTEDQKKDATSIANANPKNARLLRGLRDFGRNVPSHAEESDSFYRNLP